MTFRFIADNADEQPITWMCEALEVSASEHYQRTLSEEGITCSMSEVGQCWDNAPMESFFGRLKCEVAPREMFATRDQARAELFEYLEVFYNRVRLHSSLGFLSPVEFERTYNQKHR